MNFKSGQKINIICKIKYLGLILDEHLTFKKYHLSRESSTDTKQSQMPSLKNRYFAKFLLY